MEITLVAALARNGVIGRDNRLPWRLPADLRHFRRITLGHPVLMGRRTWESIGKPLAGRLNIVLSREPGFQAPGCVVVRSLEEGMKAAGDCEELMVIGGATVYRLALPLATRMYLTVIHQDFTGDTRFVDYDPRRWREAAREDHAPDDDNPYAYSFITLERQDNEDVPRADGGAQERMG